MIYKNNGVEKAEDIFAVSSEVNITLRPNFGNLNPDDLHITVVDRFRKECSAVKVARLAK